MFVEGFSHWVVLYTERTEDGGTVLFPEHMAGFEDKPNLFEVQAVLQEFMQSGKLPKDRPTYMIQLPQSAILEMFGFGGLEDGI